MKNKFIIIITILSVLVIAYFYKHFYKNNTIYNNSTIETINTINSKWTNKSYIDSHRGYSMPDECYDNDYDYCYDRTYHEVKSDADTECNCIVGHNGKEYKETFNIKIKLEFDILINTKNFGEYIDDMLNKYCEFTCNDMADQIKNGEYIGKYNKKQ